MPAHYEELTAFLTVGGLPTYRTILIVYASAKNSMTLAPFFNNKYV